MIKKILSTALVMIISASILSGCGITESSELMTGARKFIEKGEYDKAMANLSKVIEEDDTNSEARGMYYQAMKLKKAQYYADRKYYDQEVKELQDLINDNSGSSKIRSQAEDMLDKAQELLKNQNRAEIVRKENAKKSAEENKNKYRTYDIYKSSYGYGYNNYTRKNKYGRKNGLNGLESEQNDNSATQNNQNNDVNNTNGINQTQSNRYNQTNGYGRKRTYRYRNNVNSYNSQSQNQNQ